MAQPATGTAVLVHLITHSGCCKHCCNSRRHGEQSQGRDLQASANLLCVCADCCSFTRCWQSWQASMGGGFNLLFWRGDSAQPLTPACAAAKGLEAGWGLKLGWWPCPRGAEGPRTALWGGHGTPCCGGHGLVVCGSHLSLRWSHHS